LTDRTIDVITAATLAEQAGMESIWVGEHSHLPVSTVHRYTSQDYAKPGSNSAGKVPELYRRFVDPYVTLALAAAATSTLRIGTAIALPAEHAPLQLAKTIATLDLASGGRFEWGIGLGWNRPEIENNGVPFDRRRDVLREKVAAVRRLWTEESTAFNGEFVRFIESWSLPKPAQHPHPPILFGAKLTPRNVREIVEWADGCIPVRAMARDAEFEEAIEALRRSAGLAGRDPSSLRVSLLDPAPGFGGKRSLEAFVDSLPGERDLDRYRRIGVRRLILGIPVADLAGYAGALEAIRGSVVGEHLRKPAATPGGAGSR
jgi:probable F420-dependent oxidoreductase